MRALPARGGILGQTGHHHPLECPRRQRLIGRDRRRIAIDDGGDEAGARFPFERPPAGGHLVEDRAEGEDVRPRIGFCAFELLRRHVLECAEDGAFLRQRFVGGLLQCSSGLQPAVVCRPAEAGRYTRQAEVEQFRRRLRDHHVARLQIAVNDPRGVGALQRGGDLDAVANDVGERQRTFGDPVGERFPLQVLHDQVIDAVLMADVVQRANVRMRQAGDHLRFPLKAKTQLRVAAELRRQYLHGDGAIEARVARAVDLAHPAGADGRDDLVRPKPHSGLHLHGRR